jgi:hypothetical protein
LLLAQLSGCWRWLAKSRGFEMPIVLFSVLLFFIIFFAVKAATRFQRRHYRRLETDPHPQHPREAEIRQLAKDAVSALAPVVNHHPFDPDFVIAHLNLAQQ